MNNIVRRNIQRDPTSKKPKYYCILQNPYVDYYSTEVIHGGSPEVVKRKIDRQMKKWSDSHGSRKTI